MGYTDLEGEKLTLMQKVQNNWNGFRTFMWNPEERTVMGRGGKSWAKISLFYLIYYSFLAGFWAAMLAVFLQTVSYNRPKFTAYVSTPALNSIPVPDDEFRVRWYPEDEESVMKVTRPLLDIHDELIRSDVPDAVDCTNLPVGSIEDGQRFCKFDVEMLGECNNPPYFGWDTLNPCLFLRLNRVYGWTPENYEAPEDIPEKIRPVYMDNNIAVNCFARRPDVDEEHLNSTTPFPKNGISFGFFPFVAGAYMGNRVVQPIVAVQVSLQTYNVAVQLECRTFTGNIDPRKGLFDTDEESQTRVYLTARKDE